MSCCTEGQRTELGWGCAAREVQGALHRGWEYLRTRGEGRAGNAGGRWGELNVHQAGEMQDVRPCRRVICGVRREAKGSVCCGTACEA